MADHAGAVRMLRRGLVLAGMTAGVWLGTLLLSTAAHASPPAPVTAVPVTAEPMNAVPAAGVLTPAVTGARHLLHAASRAAGQTAVAVTGTTSGIVASTGAATGHRLPSLRPTPVDDTVRLPVRAPVAAGPGTPARAATRTGTATGTATAGRHASRTSAAMSTQRGHQPGEPAAPYPGGPDATATAGYSSPHVHDRIPPADPGAAAVDPVPASGGIAAGTQRRPRAAAIRPTVRPD